MSCFSIPSILKKTTSKSKSPPSWTNGDSSSDEEGLSHDGPRKLFADKEVAAEKLVSVLVTIASGSTYDEMFRETRPSTVPGERVSTYLLDCQDVGQFHSYLSGDATPAVGTTWHSLMDDIRQVEVDSVTFNWECCSGCGDNKFPAQRSQNLLRRTGWFGGGSRCRNATMTLMGLALKRGFTVMCSDFSLKALIAEWSEEHLGPNPFVQMGACDRRFKLEFIPSELQNEEVPQQLQVVGELCKEEGSANVTAMSQTIVYTVNPRRKATDLYSLKVLTVATSMDLTEVFPSGGDDQDSVAGSDDASTVTPPSYIGSDAASTASCTWSGQKPKASMRTVSNETVSYPEAMKCSVGEEGALKSGMAGHVTLTYASGGQLVTSMGHWIELSRINTSEETLFNMAAKNFGGVELREMQDDFAIQASAEDRDICLQKWSKSSISKSVPTRMKCRTKY